MRRVRGGPLVLVLVGVLVVLAIVGVVVVKATGVEVRDPTASCDLLSREEASAVVGELDQIVGGSERGLPTCFWAGTDGRVLTASAAPADLWASRLPLLVQDLRSTAPPEGAAAVDAFGAVVNSTAVGSPAEGCAMHSQMLTTLGGRPAGTTRTVDVVAGTGAVTATSCTDGEWVSVALGGGGVSGGPAERTEVEQLLEVVDRHARALPDPEVVVTSGIVIR